MSPLKIGKSTLKLLKFSLLEKILVRTDLISILRFFNLTNHVQCQIRFLPTSDLYEPKQVQPNR